MTKRRKSPRSPCFSLSHFTIDTRADRARAVVEALRVVMYESPVAGCLDRPP